MFFQAQLYYVNTLVDMDQVFNIYVYYYPSTCYTVVRSQANTLDAEFRYNS